MADLNEYYQITPASGAANIASGQGPQPSGYNAPGITNLGGTITADAHASGTVIMALVLLAGAFVFLHYRE